MFGAKKRKAFALLENLQNTWHTIDSYFYAHFQRERSFSENKIKLEIVGTDADASMLALHILRFEQIREEILSLLDELGSENRERISSEINKLTKGIEQIKDLSFVKK